MMPRLVAVIAAIATLGMASAHAEPAFSTADVNMRAGPDVEFPPVAVIPEGEPVYIKGCLRDKSWCDVVWEDDRGWVYSEYLALDYRGELMPLPDVGLVEFRIPIISFAATDYWGRYYVGRPWYRDRDRWFSYRIRSRQGWHAPPPGPRRPGWWRSGYHVPSGMRPPPDRGWRRPIHHGPRGLRDDRNERGEDRGDRVAAAGVTNGVTMKEVIVATVTRRVTSAVIVGITVGASAVMIAVKITSVRTAVIAARPAVKIALAGSCRAMVLVAGARGPTAAVKRPAIGDIMESVAATGAMKVMTGAV